MTSHPDRHLVRKLALVHAPGWDALLHHAVFLTGNFYNLPLLSLDEIREAVPDVYKATEWPRNVAPLPCVSDDGHVLLLRAAEAKQVALPEEAA